MLPVFLSIVAGVTYQRLTEDVQTAWTIASYVVTAVGGRQDVDLQDNNTLTYTTVVAALLGLGTALAPA